MIPTSIALIFPDEKANFFRSPSKNTFLEIAPTSIYYAKTKEEFLKVLQNCTNDFYCRTIIAIGKVFYSLKFDILKENSSLFFDRPITQGFQPISTSYFRLNCATHLFILEDDSINLALKILKQYYYLIDGQALLNHSKKIGNILKEKNWTISTAESCTGGLICKTLTDVSGASSYVLGGACTYTSKVKNAVLHVPTDIINKFGVVSQETAKAMAKGTQNIYMADIGVSTTGVAGPGPDEKNNPEGLVYIGIYVNNTFFSYKYSASLHTYLLDRDVIRKSCVLFIFKELEKILAPEPHKQ